MLLSLLLACDPAPTDSSPVEDTDEEVEEDYPEPTGGEVLEVGFDGVDPPAVGDSWTVWPLCDGNVVTGSMVLRVDPVTCATIADNELTFAEAGVCEVMVQSGSQKAYLEVDVLPGR